MSWWPKRKSDYRGMKKEGRKEGRKEENYLPRSTLYTFIES